jgi:magnesium transporter
MSNPVAPIRVFWIRGQGQEEIEPAPSNWASPQEGFLWIGCTRSHFSEAHPTLLPALERLTGAALLDLHVSDLLNAQLASRHDETSDYDLLIFRRLGRGTKRTDAGRMETLPMRGGPPILQRIDTAAVGFAVFDRVLLTIHPDDGAVRDSYAARLLPAAPREADTRSAGARGVPADPRDATLRIISQIVDDYLELRGELSRQLEHWQNELLHPRSRFSNWSALLQARTTLHELQSSCEDQHSAVDRFAAGFEHRYADTAEDSHRVELLRVRAQDVLEHIERVMRHVTRLEHNIETAVQMHFAVQGHRTNDIMRTLTALTAIFLPLNLITGFFDMNFEFMPFIHNPAALAWTAAGMVLVAVGTGLFFWRRHYLAQLPPP